MSSFSVPVTTIASINRHPDADRLAIVQLNGMLTQVIVQYPTDYTVGQRVCYIPADSIVPENIQRELGVEGKLAGSQHNRVKAIRLRGVFSEGLLYHATSDMNVGHNVADRLGITKYQPEIPANFSGVLAHYQHTVSYDLENFERYPDLFDSIEHFVVVTEKIHGTQFQLGFDPLANDSRLFDNSCWITSKGLAARQCVFDASAPDTVRNLYARVLCIDTDNFAQRLRSVVTEQWSAQRVTIFGEVYGRGVQDLSYGAERPEFRVYDAHIADPNSSYGRFLDEYEKQQLFKQLGVERVPVLYEGEFNRAEIETYRDGKTVVGGTNIREGVVITSAFEQRDPRVGRVIAKWISPNYKVRANGTEYN
jgi:RNA ligase (TIGR02306 family)